MKFIQPKLKVLIIGSDSNNAIETYYLNHLRQNEVEVNIFPASTLFQNIYHSSFLSKIQYRLGISSILNKINVLTIEYVHQFKPDIVWIFKGMEIYPSTLHRIKNLGIKLVNYNPDNPYIFSGRGSGNSNVSNGLKYYDLYLTYSTDIQKEIQNRDRVISHILPFGYEHPLNIYSLCRDQKEISKISFVGNPDKQRVSFLKKIINSGIHIDLFGHHWKQFIKHKNVTINDPIYNVDLWKCLYRYRIQLNLLRIHNHTSHNMRSFEVPSIGGIMLAPYTEDHAKFYDDGKEVFLFRNIDECINLVKNILSLREETVNEIRINARNRSHNSNYSYAYRSNEVKNIFIKLLNNSLY